MAKKEDFWVIFRVNGQTKIKDISLVMASLQSRAYRETMVGLRRALANYE